jgi:hypothetical protein
MTAYWRSLLAGNGSLAISISAADIPVGTASTGMPVGRLARNASSAAIRRSSMLARYAPARP